ncbi:helix-turn-helix domain-containing protein [Pseudohongiella spirulinae]|uniref:HTH cro/C1-type domain-containing protein n=1 Tax=Pseudohongiella spirulinae TaxID=1249552 RepID=A0A0S2KE89_9GAMM|nr:helix-turn-helix transcriptional regulator [Pseudohongiella spirulinae]ALO46388.1 hypothetical protein PS2015_1737 [Pseudohongiella spirulinae]
MPSKSPAVTSDIKFRAREIGRQIRTRRKALGVSATALAESVDMSRVTVHRMSIE